MADTPLQLTREGLFNPTPLDVYIARRLLEGLRLAATPPRLPTELALMVLSLAAYQPRVECRRSETNEYRANDFWAPGPTASVAALYLTTPPLLHRGCRAAWVTVQLRAADQGWADAGGHGTYVNSHTWFEVSILRPVAGSAGRVEPQEQPLESGTLGVTFPSPEDAGQALRERGWQIVETDGTTTWKVHHNSELPPTGYSEGVLLSLQSLVLPRSIS